jgi:hypothetical protein
MHLVDVVLFAHITVAIAAFCVAGILHTAQWVLRGATSTSTLKAWGPVVHRLEPLFPILALALFGLGAWLVHLSAGEFRWGDGWVISSVVGLAIMEIVGGVFIAPRSKKLVKAIEEAPDGAVSDALRAGYQNAMFWATTHFATGVAIGIVFLMATKPSGAASVVVLVIAAAAGLALGVAGARDSAPRYTMVGATQPAAVSATAGDGQ